MSATLADEIDELNRKIALLGELGYSKIKVCFPPFLNFDVINIAIGTNHA